MNWEYHPIKDILRPYHIIAPELFDFKERKTRRRRQAIPTQFDSIMLSEVRRWIEDINLERMIDIKFIPVESWGNLRGYVYHEGMIQITPSPIRFHRKSDMLMFKLTWGGRGNLA